MTKKLNVFESIDETNHSCGLVQTISEPCEKCEDEIEECENGGVILTEKHKGKNCVCETHGREFDWCYEVKELHTEIAKLKDENERLGNDIHSLKWEDTQIICNMKNKLAKRDEMIEKIREALDDAVGTSEDVNNALDRIEKILSEGK